MAQTDIHQARFTIETVPNEHRNMGVSISIDSQEFGREFVQSPAVPIENWQIDAYNRTVNYIKNASQPDINLQDQNYGTYLLKILLAKPEWKTIFGSLLRSSRDNILLEITTSDPELLAYPWEACAHADWRELDLPIPANPILVVRSPAPYRERWPASEPVRILVAGVSAYGLSTPNFDKEYRTIEEALLKTGLEQDLRFDIFPLRATTHQLLQKNVYDYQPHIIHFVTHGAQGKHYLETSDGQPIQIPGSLLASALNAGSESLCLFVSTACMAMQENPDSNIWGLGRILSEIVPITIGMQIAITEEAALIFTNEFYSSLGASSTVLKAFTQARERIKNQRPGSPEWIAPVIYRGTAIDTYLFSPFNVAVLLSEYSKKLDAKMLGLRKDSYNYQLWNDVDEIMNNIDVRLIDGFQKKEFRLGDEQIPLLGEIEEKTRELRININNIRRFLKLSENSRNKIELADLELKHDISSKITYSFELARQLRNSLMKWREYYP